MNPIEVLGNKFEEVESTLSHSGTKNVFDDLEAGEQQEYSVSALDESWEISLGEGNLIKTIFLHDIDKFSDSMGFNSNSSESDINMLFGKPAHKGEQSESAFLGTQGSWERYDLDDKVIHIEHYVDSNKIKMVTIMLPEAAP